jgi:hypothetical protein
VAKPRERPWVLRVSSRDVTALNDASNRPAAGTPDDETLGVVGNERLTAWAGTALLLGFGAELLTLLDVHWYMQWHLLIGYALLAPVALKLASTGYRFARYYTNAPAYRRKGPPNLLLRVLGPVLVLLTGAVLATGVGLMFFDGHHRQLEELHETSFWAWLVVVGVHVLFHVWRMPGLLLADVLGRETPRAAAIRRIALTVGAGGVGLAVAALLLPWIRDWIAR